MINKSMRFNEDPSQIDKIIKELKCLHKRIPTSVRNLCDLIAQNKNKSILNHTETGI